jgi:hypothetical protein
MTWFSRCAFAVLWVFVCSIPSEKIVDVPGFGTFSKLIGFVAMSVGMLAVLMERRVRVPTAFHTAMAVYMTWTAFTVRWTMSTDWTSFRLNTFLQLFFMVLLIFQLTDTERRVHALLNAYVIGTFVPVVGTVSHYLSGHMSYYQRYSLSNTEPNDLAVTLALSLPISYYLFLQAKGAVRLVYVVQMLTVCVNVLLTASRAGSVAMLVGLSILLWTSGELTPRMRAGVVAVTCLLTLGIFALVPVTSWNRLATLGSEVTAGTLNSRTVIWQAGWENFASKSFLGVGAGAFPESVAYLFGRPRFVNDFTPVAHNTFLSVLVETGVIGFGCFAFMLAILVSFAWGMPGLRKPVWLTILAVWGLAVMSLTWEDRKPTWFIFGVLAAHHVVMKKMPATVERYRARLTSQATSGRWEEAVS